MEATGGLLDDPLGDFELDFESEIEQNVSLPAVDSNGYAEMGPLDFKTTNIAGEEWCVRALKLMNNARYEIHDLLDDIMFGKTAAHNYIS
jgi:hypothetical protein